MSKEIYTIFDFETTGLNNPVGTDQVIEVAALRTDLEKDYGAIQMFVKLENGRTLSDFIKNLTGIKEEDIEYGVDERVAVNILLDFMEGTTAVAHHYPFDSSFVFNASFEGLGARMPKSFICTRVLAKLVEPSEKASLKDVAARLGISLIGHHQATVDVRATKDILAHYLPIAVERYIDFRNVVINDKERPLNFIPANAKEI